jgi:hypothetical protein
MRSGRSSIRDWITDAVSTQTFILFKENTVVNTSYLARAFATAASVLLPIAGHGDTGTRGPANAWVLDVYPSLMPEVAASAR